MNREGVTVTLTAMIPPGRYSKRVPAKVVLSDDPSLRHVLTDTSVGGRHPDIVRGRARNAHGNFERHAISQGSTFR